MGVTGLATAAMVFGVVSGVCAMATLLCLPRLNRRLYEQLGKPPSLFDPQAFVLLNLLRPAYLRELHVVLRVLVIGYAMGLLAIAMTGALILGRVISTQQG